MPKAYAILVQGFNYFQCPEKGKDRDFTNFRVFCDNRRKLLSQRFSDITFLLFDVGAGVVKRAEGPRGDWQTEDPFWTSARWTKITCEDNYTERVFNKNPTDRMSITDAYKCVKAMGRSKDKAGTLVELSFFAHGWYAGPILVNSDGASWIGRNPDDKDGRHKKDFQPPEMKDQDRKEFRAAFAGTASIWVWGCDTNGIFDGLLPAIRRTSLYRQKDMTQWQDADTFRLVVSPDHKNTSDYLHAFLRDNISYAQAGRSSLSLEINLAQLKAFFRQEMEDTYGAKIAKAAGVQTFGALPGTWASTQVEDEKAGLMHVRMTQSDIDKHGGVDFSKLLSFYRIHLGVSEDPEPKRLGYGRFAPAA